MAYKEKREMRVYAGSDQSYHDVPQIKIQGKWLEELGFRPGTHFEVQCENGKLTLKTLEAAN